MTVQMLPLWVTIPGTVLLVLGGVMIVAGSLGLLRFPDFFARLHGPSMGNTLGVGAMLITSMLATSALAGRPMLHELLITALLVATAPMTSFTLVQAALYRNRARQARKDDTQGPRAVEDGE